MVTCQPTLNGGISTLIGGRPILIGTMSSLIGGRPILIGGTLTLILPMATLAVAHEMATVDREAMRWQPWIVRP